MSHLDCSSAPVPAAHACLCYGVTSVLPLDRKLSLGRALGRAPGRAWRGEVPGPGPGPGRRSRHLLLPPPGSRGRKACRTVDLEPRRAGRQSPGDAPQRAGARLEAHAPALTLRPARAGQLGEPGSLSLRGAVPCPRPGGMVGSGRNARPVWDSNPNLKVAQMESAWIPPLPDEVFLCSTYLP